MYSTRVTDYSTTLSGHETKQFSLFVHNLCADKLDRTSYQRPVYAIRAVVTPTMVMLDVAVLVLEVFSGASVSPLCWSPLCWVCV